MAGTAQAFLLVIVICVASASAGPSVRSQDALSTPLSAQVIKLGMSVENNLDAGESRPDGEDLGQYLGSGLALANGQLYRMLMQETTGKTILLSMSLGLAGHFSTPYARCSHHRAADGVQILVEKAPKMQPGVLQPRLLKI